MTDHRIGLVRALLFGGSALVMLGACTLASRALGHDIYQGVRSPAGQLCCGGDPVTGDCEGSYDFRVNARGDVTFKWRPAAPKPAAVLAGCSGRAGDRGIVCIKAVVETHW